MIVQSLDAAGLAAIYCTDFLFLFFFPSTPAVSTSRRGRKQGSAEGPPCAPSSGDMC